jgi:hypothetical protein
MLHVSRTTAELVQVEDAGAIITNRAELRFCVDSSALATIFGSGALLGLRTGNAPRETLKIAFRIDYTKSVFLLRELLQDASHCRRFPLA